MAQTNPKVMVIQKRAKRRKRKRNRQCPWKNLIDNQRKRKLN
jgi:hypothetical protein